MKSLVLKDLYNVGHTARSMLFIMAVLAVAFLSTSGVEGYIFMCAVLCSMMIVTTFAFDDASKWERTARHNHAHIKEGSGRRKIYCAGDLLRSGKPVWPDRRDGRRDCSEKDVS